MSSENETYYAVEKIIGTRTTKTNETELLIKWKDYPESENSWQLATDLFSKKKSDVNSLNESSEGNATTENTPLQKRGGKQDEELSKRARSKNVDENIGDSDNESITSVIASTQTQFLKPSDLLFEMRDRSNTVSQIEPSSNNQQQIDRVEQLRKRKDQHEYLVKWKNDKSMVDDNANEWISSDIMMENYPQDVIKYLEGIIVFTKENINNEQHSNDRIAAEAY